VAVFSGEQLATADRIAILIPIDPVTEAFAAVMNFRHPLDDAVALFVYYGAPVAFMPN